MRVRGPWWPLGGAGGPAGGRQRPREPHTVGSVGVPGESARCRPSCRGRVRKGAGAVCAGRQGPVASLRVPHGGVDGRAGGVRYVQVGQQRAHVQGVSVPDEDLTEDRGVGGKQYALPGRVGCEEWEDVRGPRRGGEHDVGGVRPRERCRGERDHRPAVHCEAPSGAVAEEPDQGDAVAQWEGLCAGRRGDVRREGGGGGAVTWEGARRRSDARDVCVVPRVERSSRRSPSRPALSSSAGTLWGEVECHMPSILNPNCVGGPGRGAAGRRSERYTVVVAVRSSRGETRRGEWPAVAAMMGGCVNRRHARSNCRA